MIGDKTAQNAEYFRYSIEDDTLITPAQKRYFISDECAAAKEALERLIQSPTYNIASNRPGESASEFVDRHLQYLSRHPLVKYEGYVTNLKLMTSLKRA